MKKLLRIILGRCSVTKYCQFDEQYDKELLTNGALLRNCEMLQVVDTTSLSLIITNRCKYLLESVCNA